jgi:hypothetical protein
MRSAKNKLINEILNRRANKYLIRKRLNDYFFYNYNIKSIYRYVNSYFGLPKNNLFYLCVPKQVLSCQIDQICSVILGRYLSKSTPTKTELWSLGEDAFNFKNKYKKSLLNFTEISEKKILNIRLNKKPLKDYSGLTMNSIKINNGQLLKSYHSNFLHKTALNISINDNSIRLYRSILYLLRNKETKLPDYIFLNNEDHVGEKKYRGAYSVTSKNLTKLRPPAQWFYLFHLISFLDGSRGLISAVGHEERVEGWFQKNGDLLYEICGFRPLIIDIPDKVVTSSGYESNLLEINTAVFEPGWQERIVDPEGEDLDLFEVYEFYAKQLLELRPIKK